MKVSRAAGGGKTGSADGFLAEEDPEEDDGEEEDEFVNALLDELSVLRTAVSPLCCCTVACPPADLARRRIT